jgi:pyruvate-formate lyase-activating enzyme
MPRSGRNDWETRWAGEAARHLRARLKRIVGSSPLTEDDAIEVIDIAASIAELAAEQAAQARRAHQAGLDKEAARRREGERERCRRLAWMSVLSNGESARVDAHFRPIG